jgi:H+/Cl- antiporter ClcA
MVAFLTGVTRSPFTCAILVLEMTDRNNLIFHLMLAGLVANIASLLVDKHSLYHHLKNQYIHDLIKEEADEKIKDRPVLIIENNGK